MNNKPYVIYTKESPGPASLLMKRVSEENARVMRERTIELRREAITLLAELRPSPMHMLAEEVTCSGIPCEWVYPKNSCRDSKVILYFHGGSWIFGNLKTAKAFAMYVSERASCRVLVAEYRLAPEHPYPAGLDDCFAVFRWLLANGYKPADIALMGDSAGGNLGLCLLNKLKALGYEQPACMCAASPVTDLRRDSAIASSGADLIYALLNGEERDIFSIYAGKENRENPLISPVTACLSGIAPVLIHCGGDEPIAWDNISYADKGARDGADIRVAAFKEMFHDFTVAGRILKESRQSVAGFVEFFEKHLFGGAGQRAQVFY